MARAKTNKSKEVLPDRSHVSPLDDVDSILRDVAKLAKWGRDHLRQVESVGRTRATIKAAEQYRARLAERRDRLGTLQWEKGRALSDTIKRLRNKGNKATEQEHGELKVAEREFEALKRAEQSFTALGLADQRYWAVWETAPLPKIEEAIHRTLTGCPGHVKRYEDTPEARKWLALYFGRWTPRGGGAPEDRLLDETTALQALPSFDDESAENVRPTGKAG